MRTVAEVLQARESRVWSVAPDAPVFEALRLLARHDIGALPVLQGDRLVGIFSERDYARNSILKGNSCLAGTVERIMTREVQTVPPAEPLERALDRMTAHRIRHLPVVERGRVVGVISLGDVAQALRRARPGTAPPGTP